MDPKTYKQLQVLFAKRNDSIINFYSDLLEIVPEPSKPAVLEDLGVALGASGDLYRTVCEELYKN